MPEQLPTELLTRIYNLAEQKVGEYGQISSNINLEDKEKLDAVLSRSEDNKGVLTVLISSLTYKILHPAQDIRYHQESLEGGYSGRTFDTRYVTPFMKNKSLPSMAESGWLTRSLEQNSPYTLEYGGSIRPEPLKEAFLYLMDKIENGLNCEETLDFIFQYLILARNSRAILLARPSNLQISTIIQYLNSHFDSTYAASGASRLPVLAMYAIYECIVEEVGRFQGKNLSQIERHTSADSRSGAIGDIEVRNPDGQPFEGVEVKHRIEITLQMVKDAYAKVSPTSAKRYYILSTASIKNSDKEEIEKEVERIRNLHGCQIIVNGVIDTIKYYLRLLTDPSKFIIKYATQLEQDAAIKFEHKERWNSIISSDIQQG